MPTKPKALFRRALALGADPVGANSNLALALMEQARPEEAEACLPGRSGEQSRLRGGAGQPGAGAADDGAAGGRLAGIREPVGRRGDGRRSAGDCLQPRWTGQTLHGETVLLYAEQGFGDTLQFCRYAPMVAACGRTGRAGGAEGAAAGDDDAGRSWPRCCPRRTRCPPVRLSLPAAEPAVRVRHDGWIRFPAADTVFARRSGAVGGVFAPAAGSEGRSCLGREVAHRAAACGGDRQAPVDAAGGHGAVCWRCRAAASSRLQLGPPASQLDLLVGQDALHDVSAALADWADTAGLIMGLDLVIAVDTAVAHLAGALGKPVWMLNRFDSCWRWFRGRDDTPWYPTHAAVPPGAAGRLGRRYGAGRASPGDAGLGGGHDDEVAEHLFCNDAVVTSPDLDVMMPRGATC